MTIAEVLTNEELRRHEFPVVQKKIFLAHAGDCPLPRRVAEAVADYAQQAAAGDQEALIFPRVLDDGRKLAAQLLQLSGRGSRVRRPDLAGAEFFCERPQVPQGRQHPHLSRRLSVECLSVDGAGGTRASKCGCSTPAASASSGPGM